MNVTQEVRTMILTIIFLFLACSLVLYAILGGADFGAGILEICSPKKLVDPIERAIYQAMGPVWEANHMWLVLAVVILFNGFPKLYSEISIVLHVPLTFLLIGIIIRGCAFTFRHYDTKVGRSTKFYSLAFKYSSLFTTFMLGVLAGSLIKGQFLTPLSIGNHGYWAIYWIPWTSVFCVSVGVFTCLLFAFQTSVFLLGEPISAPLKAHCRHLAKILLALTIICGGLVFILATFEQIPLFGKFFSNPWSLTCMIGATLVILPILKNLSNEKQWPIRLLLGIQTSCILGGWMVLMFPNVLQFKDAPAISLVQAAAGEATLIYLAGALIVGSGFIFPALFLLFRVFKPLNHPE